MRLCGADPATDGPLLLIANHVSWLDIYGLNAVAPARFVAKAEVRDWPVVGSIAAYSGTFFIVRGSCRDAARVKDAIASALARGERVVVFPEGTTTDGTRLGPFYAALLQAAVDTGTDVQPVAIRYLDAGGARNTAASFIDDMSFGTSLFQVVREPTIELELTFGAPIRPHGKTRRELRDLARGFVLGALGLLEAHVPRQRLAALRRRAA
jgi:1-acyl-sn-glycerol-3-phosphate acyltransferase